MGERIVYNFTERLAYGTDTNDFATFDHFYRSVFPGITSIERVTDLQTQKRGIDLYLHMANGRVVTIDEKKDSKVRDTIFLELYSDVERGTKSWLFTAECDIIAYFFPMDNRCYMLPLRNLRAAYSKNENEWLDKYKLHTIENTSWSAIGVGIPIAVLLKEVTGAFAAPITQ